MKKTITAHMSLYASHVQSTLLTQIIKSEHALLRRQNCFPFLWLSAYTQVKTPQFPMHKVKNKYTQEKKLRIEINKLENRASAL